MKQNHDKNPNVEPSTLKIGDNALIKKTGSVFDKEPVEIVKKKGSMITAKHGDRLNTRNSSFFKKAKFKPSPLYDRPNDELFSDDNDSVISSAKSNSTQTPPNMLRSQETSTNIPSTVSHPTVMRRSTRQPKRPNRLIETI